MNIFKQIKMPSTDDNFEQLTLGEVVDTNDPQQMGRVRVACPYFGDDDATIIEDLPWATPINPLAGISQSSTRGRADDKTVGPVAYGMFNTPKVGSYVLVTCLEGDPRFRIFLGAMHDQFLPHTMPHGRYTYKTTDASDDEPAGPLSSTDDPIQPLYDSQTKAFTKTSSPTSQTVPEPRKNFEYRTRGADQGVSGINPYYVTSDDNIYTTEPDDNAFEFTEKDGNKLKITYGYHKSRLNENATSSATGIVYDAQIYSWTTPGFHSISMSDNADNCRVRLRSTHGHQVIMDDTNERIYISTAGGKTWIEMDEKGNIDIYGERNISVHAEKDINFTAGDTFRVKAANGIHMVSDIGDIRLDASTDIHLNAANIYGTAKTDVHLKAADGVLNIESGKNTNIRATANITQTGVKIDLNGPLAKEARAAKEAFWTTRVPEHEPWARIMTKADSDKDNGNSWDLEYTYDEKDVGRKERGDDLLRNPKWHR